MYHQYFEMWSRRFPDKSFPLTPDEWHKCTDRKKPGDSDYNEILDYPCFRVCRHTIIEKLEKAAADADASAAAAHASLHQVAQAAEAPRPINEHQHQPQQQPLRRSARLASQAPAKQPKRARGSPHQT